MNISKFELTIKLNSDMCCGTGEGNGSNIDCLTAFDDMGLPFIPAKRLKGLLREQAELLSDFNAAANEDIEELFGSFKIIGKERKDGKIRINNAVLPNYETLYKQLLSRVTKSKVTEFYCSLRAQTAVDNDNDGVVKRGSPRLTQVVNKNNVFVTEINITDMSERLKKLLENSVLTLRNIGLGKTRGFGEVTCELNFISTENIESSEFKNDNTKATFSYTVTLIDDVAIYAGSKQAVDRITGAMIQAAFARYVKEFSGFENIYLRKVLFGDATIDGFEPIPFSYVAEKNKSDKCFSLADGYKKGNDKQYVKIDGYYRIENGRFVKTNVQMAEECHYSTKSHDIFTYKKIIKGQVFKGTVTAPESAIKELNAAIESRDCILLLGGSVSSQYARCKLEFGKAVAEKKVAVEEKMIAELVTDCVVRDKFGAISSDYNDLVEAFKKLLDFEFKEENDVDVYIKTKVGGGFNKRWKLPIQQYTAFSQGSVIVFNKCKSGKTVNETGYFRDIAFGGYGKYKLRTLSRGKEFDIQQGGADNGK